MQSLRSRISLKQWVFSNAKPQASDRRPHSRQRASSTGKPSARVSTVKGGRLLAEPTPSPLPLHLRLGAIPRGRAQTIMTLRVGRQKRNFSFCTKPELLILHKTRNFSLRADKLRFTRWSSIFASCREANLLEVSESMESCENLRAWIVRGRLGLAFEDHQLLPQGDDSIPRS